MFPYSAQFETEENPADHDPFDGKGTWLPMEAPAGDIMEELERHAGTLLPAVASPGLGVWADLSGSGTDPAAFALEWEERRAQAGS